MEEINKKLFLIGVGGLVMISVNIANLYQQKELEETQRHDLVEFFGANKIGITETSSSSIGMPIIPRF